MLIVYFCALVHTHLVVLVAVVVPRLLCISCRVVIHWLLVRVLDLNRPRGPIHPKRPIGVTANLPRHKDMVFYFDLPKLWALKLKSYW